MEAGVVPNSPSDWRLRIAAVIAAHFALLLSMGLARHWGFMTALLDLGVFDQAVWGFLDGQPFLNTSVMPSAAINWLGVHFNPVLLLFVPLYSLAPRAEWFILAQALALSLAAWPIFVLARRVSGSQLAGFLWATAYLASPFVLNAAAWDFHPISLAVPLMALGFLAVDRKDARLLVGSCLLLLTVQEHLGLTVAGFGALWGLRHGSWRLPVALGALGIAYSLLVLGVVMPRLSPSGAHPMFSDGLGQLSRYTWLGHSFGEMIRTAVTQPGWVAKTVLLENRGAAYILLLVLPFLGAPLAAPALVLPGMADLAANLLSANGMPRGWMAYHSVNLMPVLAIAGVHGVERMCRWQRRFGRVELAGITAAIGLLLGYILAPLPLPGAANAWSPVHALPSPDDGVVAVRKALPPGGALSVQSNVGAHFSQHRQVSLFPALLDRADALVLRLDSPVSKLHPDRPDAIATLAHHLQMSPGSYLDLVEKLVREGEYGIVLWQDPWLVFGRGGAAPSPAVRAQVLAKLSRLRVAWDVPDAASGFPDKR
ncbi:MAG: Protein of unknown function rane [Rhodocyclaceae bacterium]|nr:Protein of unknown function rane [Rhodocyclaceae bacterium]